MLDGKRNPGPDETDPDQLIQLLKIELMQKRAGWEQTRARRKMFRGLSFLFLFVVILVALVAYYVFFNPDRIRESQAEMNSPAPRSPTPTASSR